MGMGLAAAGGVGAAQQSLEQLLAQRIAAKVYQDKLKQQEVENLFRQRGQDQQGEQIRQNDQFRRDTLAETRKRDDEATAARTDTANRALNDQMAPGTFMQPTDPTVGRLKTVGGVREQQERPTVDVGPLQPGDTGEARQHGFIKTPSFNQADKLADNARQDTTSQAAIAAKIESLNQASEHLRMQGEVNAANMLKSQAETAAAQARADATNAKTAGANGGPSQYSQERNVRNLQSVDELMGKIGNWTAGPGSILANVPGTDARNFQAELDTLKANIAFSELTAMREASKTGGALGQVSDREEKLLSSALGALDAGQSPTNLKTQLQKVRDSIQRWQAVAGMKPAASHGQAVTPSTTQGAKPTAAELLKKYGGG